MYTTIKLAGSISYEKYDRYVHVDSDLSHNYEKPDRPDAPIDVDIDEQRCLQEVDPHSVAQI